MKRLFHWKEEIFLKFIVFLNVIADLSVESRSILGQDSDADYEDLACLRQSLEEQESRLKSTSLQVTYKYAILPV